MTRTFAVLVGSLILISCSVRTTNSADVPLQAPAPPPSGTTATNQVILRCDTTCSITPQAGNVYLITTSGGGTQGPPGPTGPQGPPGPTGPASGSAYQGADCSVAGKGCTGVIPGVIQKLNADGSAVGVAAGAGGLTPFGGSSTMCTKGGQYITSVTIAPDGTLTSTCLP
jgi:hypothetical protein